MGAYKQFLASDIIAVPFEVSKGFTFYKDDLDDPDVSISKLLGQNIYQYDFNPNVDPITGNYTIITPGTTSSITLDIDDLHTTVALIGSGSFNINGLNITLTGSLGGTNTVNTMFVPSGSNSTNSTINLRNSINFSSSIYYQIVDISASNSTFNLKLQSKTIGYNTNFYYAIQPVTNDFKYFTGGTNDVASGKYEYQRLVYHSTKQLYYTNYSESVYSDPVNNPVLVPGRDEEGNRYIGELNSPRYDNYLQTDLTYPRYFPYNTGSYIGVLSIPVGLYGNYIQPGSFMMSFPSGTFYDDGQGNIFTGSNIVGNITYTHGTVTLTGNETIYNATALGGALYGSAIYGVSIYGSIITLADWVKVLFNFADRNAPFTCSFSSSYNLYDTQYKCTIRENEYNFSLNPSLISGSYDTSSNAGTLYGFATESYFSPYITTVGLYDEQQNLLAIGKLAQPLPSSPTTDTTILINIDR